jgi:hypothetical protein
LAKTPFLPEQELWDLFINSDNDDRMGALVLMYQKHFSFLLQNYIILSKTDDASKKHKRTVRELSRIF